MHKAHFEIQLCVLRLAVGTQILVAETPCNLEISLNPRNHQHLLHLLWRLRQSVKRARTHTRWDYVVAGALRGRLNQYRCLNLRETVLGQMIPNQVGDAVSQLQSTQHLWTADVDKSVRHAGRFVRVSSILYLERRRQ